MNTQKKIIDDEGFRSKPYQDTKGIWTFGHGLTYITEEESKVIVEGRTRDLFNQVKNILKQKGISLNDTRLSVLVQMCYQMGVSGVLMFKNMWKALEINDYEKAADEMLDSQWAKKDSPARAKRLAQTMREGKEK